MKKYIHKVKVHDRPYKDSVTINTRSGGTYNSMYSKPVQKLALGEVDLQTTSILSVPCTIINNDSPSVISGFVRNTYLLDEYTLYCILLDEEIEIPVSTTNTWELVLNSKFLYEHSVSHIEVVLEGTLIRNNEPIRIERLIEVQLGVDCVPSACDENFNYVEFIFDKLSESTIIEVSLDKDDVRYNQTISTNTELVEFLEGLGMDVEIRNEL